MNKGRNIFIAMMVMLCISIQFFFILLDRNNNQGVVDNVRYVFESGDLENSDISYYSFYFVDDPKREGTVTVQPDGSRYISIEGWDYAYTVKGSDKNSCEVTYEYRGEYTPSDEGAFAVFTRDFFKSMVFGKERLLKLYEALIISSVGAVGLVIYMKAENLWVKYKLKTKEEGYEPVWEDFAGFRRAGIITMLSAGVIMILFILF